MAVFVHLPSKFPALYSAYEISCLSSAWEGWLCEEHMWVKHNQLLVAHIKRDVSEHRQLALQTAEMLSSCGDLPS